ncbi:hypothetical protein WJX73_004959 [Symbiochloris irregularis]|uniref:Malate dehydrogenase n=1 Tax=Symbiochloris irregularis TaxID=706552 RepID=A0AAW1PAA3_9CHLO
MKINPAVTQLSLYDIVGTPGVAADISHINSKAKVQGFAGPESLGEALKGCHLVIIPAGLPRKPGMTRDDLFKANASIVRDLIKACGEHCPKAVLNIISNPVNSTVPIAAEILKDMGVYDKNKLMGVTTLDVVRARTFYAEKTGAPVADVDVPVIGGHAGQTILPLFSQASPGHSMPEDVIAALTQRTQDGGTEVVQAKAGKGSATLSMAYAGALFADACLRGLNGEPNVKEYAYVQSNVVSGLSFFSTKVKLGPEGIAGISEYGTLNSVEQKALDACVPELKSSIEKGVAFAQGKV